MNSWASSEGVIEGVIEPAQVDDLRELISGSQGGQFFEKDVKEPARRECCLTREFVDQLVEG